MMFQGSAHVPDDAHIAWLEQMGATQLNGTTDYDRTNFFETVPAAQLETVLWLESDRMGFLLDTLTQKKLDTQRAVVKNERQQTTDTVPYGKADELVVQALFPAPHPFHGAVIGSPHDLDAASLDDVRAFFSHWYAPSNATLVLAGDIDVPRAKAMVSHYFGDLRKAPRPAVPIVPPAKVEKTIVINHVEKVGKLPQLRIAWLTPGFFKDGDAAADLLSLILSSKTGELHERLVTAGELAQSINAAQGSLLQQSIFEIEVTGREGVSTETLLHEVDAELDRIRKNGVGQTELQRARNELETSMMSQLQSTGGLGGKAEMLQLYSFYLNDPGHLPQDVERYAKVTAEDIQAFVKTWLSPDHRVILYAVPSAPQKTGAQP
jgi:predicted Zn-dependent peptidase